MSHHRPCLTHGSGPRAAVQRSIPLSSLFLGLGFSIGLGFAYPGRGEENLIYI